METFFSEEKPLNSVELIQLLTAVHSLTGGLFAKNEKVKFFLRVKKNTPKYVLGNEYCLRQALCHLIHNSVSFWHVFYFCVAQIHPKRFCQFDSVAKTTRKDKKFSCDRKSIYCFQSVRHWLWNREKSSVRHLSTISSSESWWQGDGPWTKYFELSDSDSVGTVLQYTKLMKGFAFAESKGVDRGSALFVCIPHLDLSVSDRFEEWEFQFPTKQNKDLKIDSSVKVTDEKLVKISDTKSEVPPLKLSETIPSLSKQLSETSISSDSATNAKKHILFAEDNQMCQKLVRLMLEKAGYHVTVANDGKEAQEIFLKNSNVFFCALLDYEMPFFTGIQVCKVIKTFDAKIPVVILTAHSSEKDKEECLGAGADEFLTKPITNQRLKEALEEIEMKIKKTS